MRVRLFYFLFVLLLLPSQALPGIISFEQVVDPVQLGELQQDGTVTFFIDPVLLPQFDPDLGFLQSISVSIAYLYTFNVNTGYQGAVAYAGGGGSLFLGGIPYGGTGGGGFFSSPDALQEGSYQMLIQDLSEIVDVASELQIFSGGSTVEWSTDATFDFNLSSNFLPNDSVSETGYLTSGTVSIAYEYQELTPEPDSLVLSVTALGALISAQSLYTKKNRQL